MVPMGHVPEEQQQQRIVIENNSLGERKIHEFNGSVEHHTRHNIYFDNARNVDSIQLFC